MYVFMHGTCQNGAAISISVQVQGPAQAPIVLPILQHCDLPQSRVPPLCCVSFWLATTRRIYMNTCIRRVTHAGSREHSLKRTHQIRENTAIHTAPHVFTKTPRTATCTCTCTPPRNSKAQIIVPEPFFRMRHCFARCWRQSRGNRVDVYPLWLRFWLRASMLQQVGAACGCGRKCGCKCKVWKLPPPVLWRCRWWRADTAVALRSPKVKLWYCFSYTSLWGCCNLCYYWWGLCAASWYCTVCCLCYN